MPEVVRPIKGYHHIVSATGYQREGLPPAFHGLLGEKSNFNGCVTIMTYHFELNHTELK